MRHAARIAGLGILIMAVAAPFAEIAVYQKLVIPGNIDETVRGLVTHNGLVVAGIFAYFATFLCDLLVAWALYVLLVPVDRSLSLLTAWFRLVYTMIGFGALLKFVTVYRILNSQHSSAIYGADQLHAQVYSLLSAFRYEWDMGLILFGIHLGLLGYLVYKSGYIPKAFGILLMISGLGWLISSSSPFLFPDADVGFLMITYFGELIFMFWLLIRGWKLQEPATKS